MSDQDTINFIRDKFLSLDVSMTDGFNEVKQLLKDHATTDAEIQSKLADRVVKLEDAKLITKGKIIAYSSMGGGIAAVLGLVLEALIYK